MRDNNFKLIFHTFYYISLVSVGVIEMCCISNEYMKTQIYINNNNNNIFVKCKIYIRMIV